MNLEIEHYLLIIVLSIGITLAILYYFLRWVFSIEKQLKNQEMQNKLLIMLLKKQGVTIEDIKQEPDYEA